MLDWKKTREAESLKDAAIYRVKEVYDPKDLSYPFIHEKNALTSPKLFVDDADSCTPPETKCVSHEDIGGDFDAANAGG